MTLETAFDLPFWFEFAATVTGGLSGGIIPYCKHEIKHEPDLLLKGLAILYQKNAKPKKQNR